MAEVGDALFGAWRRLPEPERSWVTIRLLVGRMIGLVLGATLAWFDR